MLFLGLVILTAIRRHAFPGLLYLNNLYIDHRNDEFRWKDAFVRLIVMIALPALWFAYIGTHSTCFQVLEVQN